MSKQKFSTAAVDRIGSLPDETLIHILSFFPTKQAVATSILSKRWIHLWRYVPVLKFTKTKWKDQKSYSRFEELVFSILRSREAVGNHSINTFILDPQYCYTRIPRLPISNLTCTTLKTLRLNNIYFDQLSNVDFFRWMLLDGCPVLEDLQLSNIHFVVSYGSHYFDDFENSSMLRKLNSADITACDFYFPVKSLSNLEFLCIQLYEFYHPYDFPTFNNLTRLVLNYDWDIVVQVLHHCPKLQNLEFYQDVYQDVYRTGDYIQNWVDPKSVPSCLSLNLTTCTMRDFALAGQQRNHIILAGFILENAGVLKTMSIWYYKKWFKVDLGRVLSSCPRASSACQLSIYCR